LLQASEFNAPLRIKELLENVLMRTTSIEVFTRDSGKALIQVTDNGCGMSETDARMSFSAMHSKSALPMITFHPHHGLKGESA